MNSLQPPSLRAWTAFGILSLLWGSSYLFIKIAVQDLSPLTVVAIRLTFGVALLLVVLRVQRVPLPRSPRLWGLLALAGLFNTALPFALITWSERTIDSALASILNGTTPLFSMIIAHVILNDERITGARLTGLAIGFAGLLVIVGRNVQGGVFSNLPSEMAVLGAALCYAGSAVYVRRTLHGQPAALLAVGQLGTADLFILGGVVAFEWPLRLPALALTWLAVAWLGILGTGIAYLFYFYLIREMGATRTTMVTYVIPVVGLILGVVVLKESIDLQVLLGAGLVIGGVVLANRRRMPAPKPKFRTLRIE